MRQNEYVFYTTLWIADQQWLVESFKKRNNFKNYQCHGESDGANTSKAELELPYLRALLQHYGGANFYNADEFSLCASRSSDRTIGPTPMKGRKKNKTRYAFLLYSSADGNPKLPTLATGRAARPKSFGGFYPHHLGYHYAYNKTSWMNELLLLQWLYSFDCTIDRSTRRESLLLLDNASCHGKIEKFLQGPFLHIIFLPKRTTSILQALDAGVIACLKRRYKKWLLYVLLI